MACRQLPHGSGARKVESVQRGIPPNPRQDLLYFSADLSRLAGSVNPLWCISFYF
jgi:hypothetical protein